MVVNGYVKGYMYTGDGTLMIQVRIPSIHGPYKQSGLIRNQSKRYVRDEDLPYCPSVLLPHLPSEGEVVALMSIDGKTSRFMVIGLTGGSYHTGTLMDEDSLT